MRRLLIAVVACSAASLALASASVQAAPRTSGSQRAAVGLSPHAKKAPKPKEYELAEDGEWNGVNLQLFAKTHTWDFVQQGEKEEGTYTIVNKEIEMTETSGRCTFHGTKGKKGIVWKGDWTCVEPNPEETYSGTWEARKPVPVG